MPFIHRRLLTDRWTEEAWSEGLRIHLAAGGSRHEEAAIARATTQLLRDLAAGPTPGSASPNPRPAATVSRPSRPSLPSPAKPYAADMPPLDPDTVRPFRTLDRPAGELFDTPEPVRGAEQTLEDFLASLPGLHPPGPGPATPGDNNTDPAPPGGLPSDSPGSGRQGDEQ